MVNEILVNTYCQGNTPENLTIDTTKPKTILKQLTNAKIRYTWETVRDERIDNQQSVIEVRVYLTGHILYGRYVYKTADASDAHLYAINDAIKTIIPEQSSNEIQQPEQIPTPAPTPQPVQSQQAQPLSQEQILNMIQQQNTPSVSEPITTAEQFNNDSREEIPFDDVNMDLSELDNLLSGGSAKTYEPVQQQPTNPYAFTQAQIQAINEFKQKMNITNDELLNSYINAWDNKLSRKSDLTVSNIDAFIEWTRSVGKAPC